MSTEQSLEDRAREFMSDSWAVSYDSAAPALVALLRSVDTAATERATEAARGEVERLRDLVRRLRDDGAGASSLYLTHANRANAAEAENQRLRERLAPYPSRVAETKAFLAAPPVTPVEPLVTPAPYSRSHGFLLTRVESGAVIETRAHGTGSPDEYLTVVEWTQRRGGWDKRVLWEMSPAAMDRMRVVLGPRPVTPKGEQRGCECRCSKAGCDEPCALPAEHAGYHSCRATEPVEAPPSEPQSEAPPAPKSCDACGHLWSVHHPEDKDHYPGCRHDAGDFSECRCERTGPPEAAPPAPAAVVESRLPKREQPLRSGRRPLEGVQTPESAGDGSGRGVSPKGCATASHTPRPRQPSSAPAADAHVLSRSVQRRIALQKGEELPTFAGTAADVPRGPKCDSCGGRGWVSSPHDNPEGCDDCNQTGVRGAPPALAADAHVPWPPEKGDRARHRDGSTYEFTGEQNDSGGWNVVDPVTRKPIGGIGKAAIDGGMFMLLGRSASAAPTSDQLVEKVGPLPTTGLASAAPTEEPPREQTIAERVASIAKGLYGGATDPNRCVCAEQEKGRNAGTPHRHYTEPPYACARCDCKAYAPAIAATPSSGSSPACGLTYPSKYSGIVMTCLRVPGHAPVPGSCQGSGSSPGSEAFEAWWTTVENGNFINEREMCLVAYSRGAADRDAAVSRARLSAFDEVIALIRERRKPHPGWLSSDVIKWEYETRHLGYLADHIARLSSTTETPK